MGLRCLLFSSDQGTAQAIRQVLANLDVQAESCPEAVAAVDKIAHQSFQIVIIDWDRQPEAGLLLSTARERKAAERPITLAIVSDDVSVPKALQAGANSILRKPIVVNQAKDTLKTACDLLRSRREPAPSTVGGQAADASLTRIRASMEQGKERTLRAGEFLQSGPVTPSGSFVTESDVPASLEPSASEPVDPLKDLEPVAASVAEVKPAPPPPPQLGESRGLEWYLKARGVTRQAPPPPAPSAPAGAKPELLSYDQTASQSASAPSPTNDAAQATPNQPTAHEQKKEAKLFAYIEGAKSEPASPRNFRLGKRAIFAALLLASCAIAAAPQAPWHPKMRAFWNQGQRAMHAWLNPQPVTLVQAPNTHENFARAGDEYKLPVAENIPDATTDPSQIRVLPVVDPTAKKPNNDAANPNQSALQPAVQPDGSAAVPPDPSQTPAAQLPDSQPAQSTPGTPQLGAVAPAPVPAVVPVAAPAAGTPPHSDTSAPARLPVVPNPAPPKAQPPHYTPSGDIPSSLKSQMAPSNLQPVAPKLPGPAPASIEPVVVPEYVMRSLVTEQPAMAYPANAGRQQGTVTLQVLIGRDGTVQDAKFLQGSLAFARAAIDGVKQWKFKPYVMNGRAVSVQTLLTMTFKPAS